MRFSSISLNFLKTNPTYVYKYTNNINQYIFSFVYLEEFEDDPAFARGQFQESVEVGAVRRFAVRRTEGKGQEVQECSDDKGTRVVEL